MSSRRNRPPNRFGCKPDGDVCVMHDMPLECRHGCQSASKHKCKQLDEAKEKIVDSPLLTKGVHMDHSEVKHFPKVDHTPAELDDASRLLLKAAEMIEERGWLRCFLGHSDGPVCAMGAIYYAAGSDNALYYKAAGRVGRSLHRAIDIWNDEEGRTKDEVVAKLRAVALGL